MKRKASRFGSLFLGMALLAASLLPGTALADSPASAALSRMQSLAIIPAADKANQTVSRGMLVETIVASEGLRGASASSRGFTPYSDVTPGSVLSGYINAGLGIGATQGVAQGVVFGTADGSFQPNSPVSYAEVCTVAVRLLGYKNGDLTSSPWPDNYLKEAAALGLTAGVNLGRSSNVTVGQEALIFNNVFNSQLKTGAKFFSDNYYTDTTASGALTELIVLGNAKTSDNLASNQILTNTAGGTLSVQAGVAAPALGAKYKLYVNGTTVTKATVPENLTKSYTVKYVKGTQVVYAVGKKAAAMTLPNITYYYHGSSVDYDTALCDLHPSSTLILATGTSGTGYSYGVLVDPYSGSAVVNGSMAELIVLGNSKTSDNLTSSQVLTSSAAFPTMNLDTGVAAPVLGAKYRLYVNGSTVTKLVVPENTLTTYQVSGVSDGTISYTSAGREGQMTLPQAGAYYYHGASVNYTTAQQDVFAGSTIILAKSATSKGYDYGVLVDPYTDDTIVSGTAKDGVIVLGTSQTDSSLASNQVQTTIGTLSLDDGVAAPEVGGEYRLYVDSANTITKVAVKENSVTGYAVKSVDSAAGNFVYTAAADDSTGTLSLPTGITYYYNGAHVDYAAASSAIQSYSSVLLGKTNDGKAYAVVLDPCYGTPGVYTPYNSDLLNKLADTHYDYIYREPNYTTVNSAKNGNITTADLDNYDVLYFVSDLWGKNTFVYDYAKSVYGTVTAFVPNKLAATAITVGGTTYELSPAFDKSMLDKYYSDSLTSLLNTINAGDFKEFILGMDGKIVDIIGA